MSEENTEKKTKMGRPIKNKNPRTEKLTIMLSEIEKNDIQYCSEKLGISRTDTIIKGIEELKTKL